ncbi:BamA/TamA family outer membrane protein [Saccharicrinis sp. FJH2]|uniref:Omp85 family outer membrane protein n=1 Tax=Saccharicrinis sp. FJH65 TaxID=3344659 RepID=UPI0035F3F8E6
MRKNLLLILVTVLFVSVLSVNAQDEENSDSKVKKGWNFGALPAITYNTDLGFQYGGLVNFFNYGDGSEYPDYLHNIYLEVSRFTKGSGIYRLSYDSEYLIPGMRVTSDLAYLPDMAFNFFGFNGYEAVYNQSWIDDDPLNSAYKTRMFYKMQNNTFRFKTDLQFPLSGKKLLGLVGFNLQQYTISTVDIDRLNKGKSSNLLPDTLTLYDEYVNWGIIGNDEKNGGFIPLLKAGLVYDTRDNEPNPMHGIWTEAFIFGAPKFLGAESGFLKFNITHRQYFTLIKRDLSFAYRISYQGTLAGKVPFYYQSQIETSKMKDQIGLGGSKTLRGIQRARVIGDGFVYGNVELRWKPVHFNWINQKFYIGLNAFSDFGQVVQKVDVEKNFMTWSMPLPQGYFDFGAESLHVSYGLGLRIAMNENFVIAVDFGKAVNKQDGNTGLYIGLDYLF